MVIDQGNPPVRNIIIPLPQLILFLTNNFVCRNCKLVSAKPDIKIETFGFVTGINYRCACAYHSSLRPDLLLSSKEKVEKFLKPVKVISSLANSTDFELNHRVILGLHLSGNGRKEGSILSGMMNLNCNPMRGRWTEMQVTNSKASLEIADQVLEENLGIEMALSPLNANALQLSSRGCSLGQARKQA